ncbi:IclR family transcriptional regulator [Thalassospira sp. MA62]|nr:IclR family transcriptional regulator [Thalassospira sp. MA62]
MNVDQTPAAKRGDTIQSVSIAVRFLKVLADANGPLVMGEIARRSETTSSTAHRYLQSLVKGGLATQDPASGYYGLGPMALNIGMAALGLVDPLEIAAKHMKDLADSSAASAGVAIITDRGPVLVRWYRSAAFSISSVGIGDILPLDNTACGHVFQAFLPERRVTAIRNNQPDAFRGTQPSKAVIDQVRAECWSELSNHLLPDIVGQAVPVFDAQDELACVMTTINDLGQSGKGIEAKRLLEKAHIVAAETGRNELAPKAAAG